MNKLYTKFSFGLAAIAIAVASLSTVNSYSGGPLNAVSGAPGEGTCTNCHGGRVNSGTAVATIAPTDTSISRFLPGITYQFTAKISGSNRSKFGFQVSATAGTFTVVDQRNTQIKIFNTKQYIQHTGNGTTVNTWNFDWTAPADTNISTVTFYGSVMESNNANGNGGDSVYSASAILPRAALVSIAKPKVLAQGLSLYPNPVGSAALVSFNLSGSSKVDLALIDLQGKTVATKALGQMNRGKASVSWALPELAKGTYILHLKAGEKVSAIRLQKL